MHGISEANMRYDLSGDLYAVGIYHEAMRVRCPWCRELVSGEGYVLDRWIFHEECKDKVLRYWAQGRKEGRPPLDKDTGK